MNIQERLSYIQSLAIEISHVGDFFISTEYVGETNTFYVLVDNKNLFRIAEFFIELSVRGSDETLSRIIDILLAVKRGEIEGLKAA